MNEQLIVKNFGPIKDATVDFKRVTVFIGPTGGGKSTLAKLAAVFRNEVILDKSIDTQILSQYTIKNYWEHNSVLNWNSFLPHPNKSEDKLDASDTSENSDSNRINTFTMRIEENAQLSEDKISNLITQDKQIKVLFDLLKGINESVSDYLLLEIRKKVVSDLRKNLHINVPIYFPTERVFIPAVEYSWAGLMRDDIGLPKILLSFANSFSLARKDILELFIPFFNVTYQHINGRDFIKMNHLEEPLMLLETASGIQAVTPLLVLLEYLSRNNEQAHSFIIEEPELNLFPLAQFELVKILVEKCAQTEGKNDLVLTTHSPYVLTALNLLCYAYRIAQQDEATAKKVAKLIPPHCWIDPDQFAAYYVDRPDTKRKQQVRSIINKKTGLIEENELDTASDELGAIFDKLVRLRKPTPTPSRAK